MVPCPDNKPTAIGRSRPELSFFIFAGAKFIVIFSARNKRPEFLIAVRTRSLDSRTEASGNPTMSKVGIPLLLSTSTEIIIPSTPSVVAPKVLANNVHHPFIDCIKNYHKNI